MSGSYTNFATKATPSSRLTEVILQGEEVECSRGFDTAENNESTEINIAGAEARARIRQRRNGSSQLKGTDKQFAEALHREADILHRKGDYETALVLYHRAASVCSRDSSHAVAARRTAAAINALAYPSRILNGLVPKLKNGAQLSAALCPESAAIRACQVLRESANPASEISGILRYFDERKDFWRTPKGRPIGGRSQRKRRNSMARVRDVEAALNAGDTVLALGIGTRIVAAIREKERRNGVATTIHRLMALAHVAQGRHDRAASAAARMTRAAIEMNSSVMTARALVTLGKVHLTFGHLNAAARAWESLVPKVQEAVPRAWIFHEIGRCYLETCEHREALRHAEKCLEAAEAAGSAKWTFHGQLLLGQALAQLGRLEEAAKELRMLTIIGEEKNAGDARTLAYVRDLAARVSRAAFGGRTLSGVQRTGYSDGTVARTMDGSGYCYQSSSSSIATLVTPERTPCSESSAFSIGTATTRRRLESTAAAGDQGDVIGVRASITSHTSSESIPTTGRTYGVLTPGGRLSRRSVSTTTSFKRDANFNFPTHRISKLSQ